MELLIWAGGRWRRVCASTGRVEGWRRRARFVCCRRGALRELPSHAALRSIVRGPRLPKERYGQTVTHIPASRKDVYIQTDDSEPIQREPYKPVQNMLKLTSQENKENQIATSQENKNNQVSTSQENKNNQVPTSQENKENQVSRTPQKRLRSASTEILEARPFKQQKNDGTEAKNKLKDHQYECQIKLDKKKIISHRNDIQKAADHTTDSITSNDEDKGKEKSPRKAKKNIQSVNDKEMKQLLRKDSTESEILSEEDQFKELVIHEEDVLLLRRYIETHNTNIDLLKYDEDDSYKTMIFFKINPLVRLERCPRIARMLKNRDANITVHFARQLGLKTVTEREDNEKNKPKTTKYRYAKAVATAISRSIIDSDTSLVSDVSESEYERTKKKNPMRQKQSKFQTKPNDSSSDTESLQESHSDSTIREGRKTRSNKKDYLSSDDAFESQKLKRTTREKTKSVLISDKENITRNNESKSNKERITDNKKNSKTTEIEDKLEKNTSKTRNGTDNIKKKLTEQNADSTNQDSRKMCLRKSFPIFCTSQSKTSTQTKNKKDGSDVNFNNSNDSKNKDSANQKAKDKIKNSAAENPKPKQNMKPALLRRIVVPKRSSVPPGREYSMLEDQAIVAWLSTSTERERAVNGNKLWRDLQDCYRNLTGQKRSWHSLRNRYLRYILPNLGSLALPTAQAQRLRAHATLGKLKSRKKSARNSVYNLPVVRSASARGRPRPPPSPDKGPTEAPESQRSNSPEIEEITSPKKRVLRSSLNLTQSHKDNLPRKKTSPKTSPRKSPIKSAGAKSPTKSSPTYSELTRRFLRNRSTPRPTPERTPTYALYS